MIPFRTRLNTSFLIASAGQDHWYYLLYIRLEKLSAKGPYIGFWYELD